MNLDYMNAIAGDNGRHYVCSAKEALCILKSQARNTIQSSCVFEALGFLEERFGIVMLSPSALFRKALITEDSIAREDLYFQAMSMIEANIRNNYALRLE
jgi:hypothetical protein